MPQVPSQSSFDDLESRVTELETQGGGSNVVTLIRNVDEYGAVGDGVSDDTAAIQAAIDEGGIVEGNQKTYRIEGTLNLVSGVKLRHLDLYRPGAGDLFEASGSLGAAHTVTDIVAAGDSTLPVAGGGAFSVDQYVWLESDQEWNDVDPGTFGEMVRVRSISGNILTLYDATLWGYSINAKATPITFVDNITFEDCSFVGDGVSDQQLAAFEYCRNVHIRRCRSLRFHTRHYRFDTCIHFSVKDSTISHCANAGLGYGVTANHGCQWFHIDDNYIEYCRHGINTGGTRGVNRYWSANNNEIVGSFSSGVSTHRQAELFEIRGNRINCGIGNAADSMGIIVRSTDGIVRDNQIISPHLHGIYWVPQRKSTNDPSIQIKDNLIRSPGGDGIRVHCLDGVTHRNVQITGNSIHSVTAGNSIQVRQDGSGSILGLHITGNTVDGHSGSGSAVIVNHTGTGGIQIGCISGNSVLRNDDNAPNVMLSGNATTVLRRISVTGNSLVNGSTLVQGANASNITVVGNLLVSFGSSETAGLGGGSVIANNAN